MRFDLDLSPPPFPFSFSPWTPPLTSDLLFQVEYYVNGLMQYEQFGLGFLIAQVELTHAAQLFKRLVDVPHTQTLADVVCHPPHFLPLCLHLHRKILIILILVIPT